MLHYYSPENIQTFSHAAYIFLENEMKVDHFYIILEGRVILKRDISLHGERHIEVIGPGDFFGVIGAIARLPHLESAIAETPVKLVAISHSGFMEMIQKNTSLALKIVRFYSRKLRIINDKNYSSNAIEDLNKLYNIGMYYIGSEFPEIGIYMLKSYIYHSIDSKYINEAYNELEKLGSDTEYRVHDEVSRLYKKGEVLFCEGEPGDTVYIVQKGKVRISKYEDGQDTTIDISSDGDIIGEMALIENKLRFGTVTVLEDSEILVIKRSNFELLIISHPEIMSRIMTILSERIWSMTKMKINHYLPDLSTKILDLLMIIIQKNRINPKKNNTYNFDMSIEEIFSILGSSEDPELFLPKFLNYNKFIKIEKNSLMCMDINLLDKTTSHERLKLKKE